MGKNKKSKKGKKHYKIPTVKAGEFKCYQATLDLMMDEFGKEDIEILREISVARSDCPPNVPTLPTKTLMLVVMGQIYDTYYADRDI